MKKLNLLLVFLLIMTACNKNITKTIYTCTFTSKSESLIGLYEATRQFSIDTITLNDWMHLDLSSDSINMHQNFIRYMINEKSFYTVLYNIHETPQDSIYTVSVRFTGNKKYLN